MRFGRCPWERVGLAMFEEGTRSFASVLLVAAGVILVLAGLKAAAPIVVPFLLALFLAILTGRPVHWMHRHRVPRTLSVLIMIAGMCGALALLATLSAASLSEFAEKFPTYQAEFQDRWGRGLFMMEQLLSSVGLEEGYVNLRDQFDLQEILRAVAGMAGTTLVQFGSVFTKTLLVALTVAFMLFESFDLTVKIRVLVRPSSTNWAKLQAFAQSVQDYIAVKTLTSVATGLLAFLWLLILGVDYAPFWGLLAFMLNYVPNIGSVVAAIPAVLIALMQHGPGTALVAALGYVAINLVFGSILEPKLMGDRVGLSPLVVFVSLVFWGFLLGPIGMLLSPPLTISLKYALEHYPETRWVATLLGSGKSLDTVKA